MTPDSSSVRCGVARKQPIIPPKLSGNAWQAAATGCSSCPKQRYGAYMHHSTVLVWPPTHLGQQLVECEDRQLLGVRSLCSGCGGLPIQHHSQVAAALPEGTNAR